MADAGTGVVAQIADCRAPAMGARSMSVHMQAAEPGLSSGSRGARTDPRCPEPLARSAGPLLVSAASGSQIETAPMGTKGPSQSRR
jgi:hypothetical protein